MTSLHQFLFVILWITACGYATVRGGPPERLVAALFAFAGIASSLMQSGDGQPFHQIEAGITIVDGGMFLFLVALATFSTRFWPITMASLQGAILLVHLARALDFGTLPAGYFVMAVAWSFPMLMLLGAATWRHRRRQKIHGRDYSWIHQLPAAYRAGATCHDAE